MVGPSIFDRLTCESLQRKPALGGDLHYTKPVSFDLNSANVLAASLSPPPPPSSSPLWSSKAMKGTVEEVCKDIAWGEEREIGRIGLALQDHICRDLIEEIVIELGSFQSYSKVNYSLPFEACKRRLCFQLCLCSQFSRVLVFFNLLVLSFTYAYKTKSKNLLDTIRCSKI